VNCRHPDTFRSHTLGSYIAHTALIRSINENTIQQLLLSTTTTPVGPSRSRSTARYTVAAVRPRFTPSLRVELTIATVCVRAIFAAISFAKTEVWKNFSWHSSKRPAEKNRFQNMYARWQMSTQHRSTLLVWFLSSCVICLRSSRSSLSNKWRSVLFRIHEQLRLAIFGPSIRNKIPIALHNYGELLRQFSTVSRMTFSAVGLKHFN